MRWVAGIAAVHLDVSAALLASGAAADVGVDYAVGVSNVPSPTGPGEAALRVLQFPLAPLLPRVGEVIGVRGLAVLIAALGNAGLWGVAAAGLAGRLR